MSDPQRPNILVFLTDDHGHWAMRCAGTRELHTPTMDSLAQRGAHMTHAFTPCPVCSPARASFWTGHIPSRHGIHDHIAEANVGRDHPGLTGQVNLGMRLQEAGYRTGFVGKWHCQASWNVHEGFDFWFSLAHGTQARFGDHHFNDNGIRVEDHGHQAVRITDAALRFLRQPRRSPDEPWFCYVGYTNTHSPFSGEPERLAEHYRGCSFDDIPNEPFALCHGESKRIRPETPAQSHESRAQYYAAVSMIDEQMGRILDELDSRGELENTLIVYTADHGHMNGHHGLWCKGNATTPQNFLDESIRVPCVLAWPAAFAGGQRRSEPVDHCDLHATLLDAAGTAVSDDASPGCSYLPLLRGETSSDAWRDAQFCEYANARMVRTEEAKLIRRYPGPNGHFADEFYDLKADPREMRNLIDDPQWAGVIEQLTARLEEYFARYEDPVRSGPRIADLPRLNADEPWYRPTGAAARAQLVAAQNDA